MAKTIIPLAGAMAKSGLFSGKLAFADGVRVSRGEMVFVTGQLAFDEERELVGKGDIRVQTRQVLENVKSVLGKAGAAFRDIVRVTIFIKDMKQFREIHDVRLEYFSEDNLPASTMVEVNAFTHEDALIEIEVIAVIDP